MHRCSDGSYLQVFVRFYTHATTLRTQNCCHGWSRHHLDIKRWPLFTFMNHIKSNPSRIQLFKRKSLSFWTLPCPEEVRFTPPLLSDEHNKQKWALKWWELKKKRHSLPLQNSCAATCQLRSLTSTSLGRGVRSLTPDKQMSLVLHFLFCWLVLFSEQHTHSQIHKPALFLGSQIYIDSLPSIVLHFPFCRPHRWPTEPFVCVCVCCVAHTRPKHSPCSWCSWTGLVREGQVV